MERIYLLKGLDCPHCAAEIEKAVAKIAGVSQSAVNLMQQTLTVHAAPAAQAELTARVTKIVHTHEPDVEVTEQTAGQTCVYTLKGLDCPHCAEEIAEAVRKLEAVSDAQINLMNRTLTVQVNSAGAVGLTGQVREIVHAHEPDVEVTEQTAGQTCVYTLKGLDCPHCAEKIAEAVRKLEAVSDAQINLMNQMLTVQVDPAGAVGLTGQVREIVHAHEPDVEVIPEDLKPDSPAAVQETLHDRTMLIRLISGGGIWLLGMVLHYALHAPAAAVLCVMLTAYAVLGWDVVWQALRNITKGRVFDEHFLMTVSTVGAFGLGEYPEAAAVMLFYQIGEYFQALAVKKSRRSISALLDIRPDTATVLRDGTAVTVPPDTVAVGEIILVKPGERIPLDGTVTEGSAMLDTAALTGESVPRRAEPGDPALSGCIDQNGTLKIQVTKSFGQSTATKIIEMVENAAARKAPAENFITRFARVYTPAVVIAALLLAVIPPLLLHAAWTDWVRRAFVFLIVSCPCALVISIPLTFFGGIGAASRRGVLVKGSNDLDALSRVTQIVFDKTGTLTEGEFRVRETVTAEGGSAEALLSAAASLEENSNHPIARSVLDAAGQIPRRAVTDFEEIAGHGIRGRIGGRTVLAGNAALMAQERIAFAPCDAAGTKVYVAEDGVYLGCIVIGDAVRPGSAETVSALKRSGIRKAVMLTGDDRSAAEEAARSLGLDEYHAELLPADKVRHVEEMEQALPQGEALAFVGDGINDAPVLARADVGIAMGALGSDAAVEAADIVLMDDDPLRICDAIQVARKTKRIVMQNIVFALGVKLLFLVLGAFGIAGMWEAVFGDVGVTVLAVLNALRAMRDPSSGQTAAESAPHHHLP